MKQALLQHGSVVAVLLSVQLAHAQFYSCTDTHGRKLTSDRPIAECANKNQRQVLRSGAVKIVAPQESRAEQYLREQELKQERRQQEQLAQIKQAQRQLALRFPNEAAYQKHCQFVLAGVEKRWEHVLTEFNALQAEREALRNQTMGNRKTGQTPKTESTKRAIAIEQRLMQIDGQVQKALAERNATNQQLEEQLIQLKSLWSQSQQAMPETTSQSRKINSH